MLSRYDYWKLASRPEPDEQEDEREWDDWASEDWCEEDEDE